jgi:DNA-directed RNA polymerase alpha subunit/DNA-directed RNA polymerase subunit L
MADTFRNLSRPRPQKLEFDVENVDVSVVNALRRIILSEVPSVAISFDPIERDNDITIEKNTCSLHNEFLAHRFSLVPLHFTQQEIDSYDPDKYKFVLKVKNETDAMMVVTTKDVVMVDETGKEYPKTLRDRIFPPFVTPDGREDYILITKLKPNLFDMSKGDEVSLTAKATVGVGKSHARWCPVSMCAYHNNLDDELVDKEKAAYIKKMAETGHSEEEHAARFDTLEKYRCYKKNKYLEPCSFHFDVETECALAPHEIFHRAIEVLAGKVKEFGEHLKDDARVKVHQSQGMHHIVVLGEDHTLGNLIQSLFYNMFVRKEKELVGDEFQVSYVGYYKPHPLEESVVIKVKAEGDIYTILSVGCARIVWMLDALLAEWQAFSKK